MKISANVASLPKPNQDYQVVSKSLKDSEVSSVLPQNYGSSEKAKELLRLLEQAKSSIE